MLFDVARDSAPQHHKPDGVRRPIRRSIRVGETEQGRVVAGSMGSLAWAFVADSKFIKRVFPTPPWMPAGSEEEDRIV